MIILFTDLFELTCFLSTRINGLKNIWTYQTSAGCGISCSGGGHHDFGINLCYGADCVQWGFIQSNQDGYESFDVVSGIGLSIGPYLNDTSYYSSCGDFNYNGWCNTPGNCLMGFDGPMYSSIWGRRA